MENEIDMPFAKSQFALLLSVIALASCVIIRQEGDIDGFYCREYLLPHGGDMNTAVEKADVLARSLNAAIQGDNYYELDGKGKWVKFGVLLKVHDRDFPSEIVVSAKDGSLTIAFAVDWLGDPGRGIPRATESDMKAIFKKWDEIYRSFENAER